MNTMVIKSETFKSLKDINTFIQNQLNLNKHGSLNINNGRPDHIINIQHTIIMNASAYIVYYWDKE